MILTAFNNVIINLQLDNNDIEVKGVMPFLNSTFS